MAAGDALRSRLGELVRSRRGGAGGTPGGKGVPPARGARARSAAARATGVEAFLPGGEWRNEQGVPVFVHERLRSEIEKPRPHWARLPEPPTGEPELSAIAAMGLERILFLDLETCGLAAAPVFLAGTMHWNGTDFVLRQYFARDYAEEPALLAAVSAQAGAFDLLVTFNGKSFDVPFLASRALTHGVPLTLPRAHFDLLHASRRRWRLELPDCRLQTLESRVCRRRRTGDVPGSEVPGLYHDYVKRGDPWRLVPVFHHNLLDVITMADILFALCDGRGPRPPRRSTAPARQE
ncbi:MAG: ribonuclease H-like domain-containing protein [Candidatus Eisenbacteria bacterium]|nr:ribonuclease H-like domain-containing protein [Candidatus Eisenbacteria bacterium]